MSKIKLFQLFFLSFIVTLTACSEKEFESEEEFLDNVRKSADSKSARSETGALGGEAGGTPIIELETTKYSMGNVPPDRVTTKTMLIHNRGTVPLQISDIRTSCYCTEGEMASTEIPPGKSADLQIHFHPDRVPGQFHAKKRLTIFSNDPKMPQVGVTVETFINPELKFESKILTLPSVEAGKPTEGYITIFQLQEKPIKISNAALGQDMGFMTPSVLHPPKSEWADPETPEIRILVKVDETAPVGTHKNMIKMNTDLVRFKNISIPVEVKITGIFTINPDAVTLRNIIPGEVQEKIFAVESNFPVILKNMENENENFKITSRTNADTGHVEFDLVVPERPDNRLQKDNLALTLEVDGKEFTETIRVVALIKRD
jgi:hypothetical protein